MSNEYTRTGRFTKDGQKFHYEHCNLLIGRKRYCNVSEAKFLELGFFPEVRIEVPYADYQAEIERLAEDPDLEDFLYANRFIEIDGNTYWVKYEPSQNE